MAHEFVVDSGPKQKNFVFHEHGITMTGHRKKHVRWEKFRTLWTLKNSFLLFYSETNYFIFPKAQMPETAATFLVEKLKVLGVRFKTLGT